MNLGAVGFFILIAWIIATLLKCRQDLLTDFEWGRLTMGYLFGIVAHNWTEAGFKGLSLMLLVFLLLRSSIRLESHQRWHRWTLRGWKKMQQWMYGEAKV